MIIHWKARTEPRVPFPRWISTAQFVVLLHLLTTAGRAVSAVEQNPQSLILDAVPQGYFLRAYDDCGIPARQPHVIMNDSYCWTFNTSDTDADLKSRSAVFSYKSVNMLFYTDLDPRLSYVLAVTYANDHVYKRIQNVWANGVPLHEPYAIPKAKAVRLVVKVPEMVTRSGRLALEFRIDGEVNATVSIAELWANASPEIGVLRVGGVTGFVGDLTGQVLDLAYDPVAGASIELLSHDDPAPLAETSTGTDGWFRLPRQSFETRTHPF